MSLNQEVQDLRAPRPPLVTWSWPAWLCPPACLQVLSHRRPAESATAEAARTLGATLCARSPTHLRTLLKLRRGNWPTAKVPRSPRKFGAEKRSSHAGGGGLAPEGGHPVGAGLHLGSVIFLHVLHGVFVGAPVGRGEAVLDQHHVVAVVEGVAHRVLHAGVRPAPGDGEGLEVQ